MVMDDVISRTLGNWGKFQQRAVLLIFLTKIPTSWFMACLIFTAPIPEQGEFFCKPPTIIPHHNKSDWIKVLHSEVRKGEFETNVDYCHICGNTLDHSSFNETFEDGLGRMPPTNSPNTIPCEKFEHLSEYISIITSFDLVCSRNILVSTSQFLHQFGVLGGGVLVTVLLIYISPKRIMLFGMITQIIAGLLTGFVTTFGLHLIFRCIAASGTALMFTPGAVIFSDITGGRHKTIVTAMFEQFWSIGLMLLPLVAGFITNYTLIYTAISLPTIGLIALYSWIPDSPRWFLVHGKTAKAKQILEEAALVNGTSHNLPSNLQAELDTMVNDSGSSSPPISWWSLWVGHHAKRRMIFVHLCWSIYLIAYFGMILNIREFGREYLHANTVIVGICEIIGTFIGLFFILKTKRKWRYAGFVNIITAFISLCLWFIPKGMNGIPRVTILMVTSMCMKIGISTIFCILITCTGELVCVEKRKILAFSTVTFGRFCFLSAPFILSTSMFGQFVPQTVFGCLALIAGIITIFIDSPKPDPKTVNEKINMEIFTIQEEVSM